jgi:4-alpha-glucanotransferase
MNERLARLAALHGVEHGYEDVFREWQQTPESAIRAVLAAMGVEAGTDAQVDASIAMHEREARRRVVPPVWVRRAANLREGIPVHLPQDALTHTL